MNRLISLLLAALALAACETAVDIALPEEEPRLVVNALFHADSLWAVGVSASRSVLTDVRPEPVTQATVEVLEGGEVVETLAYRRASDLYRSRRHRPQAGRTYTVRVSAPGFPTAEATATVPEPLPFSIDVRRVEDGYDAPSDVQAHEIAVTFSDPGGTANYYALGVYRIIEIGRVRAYSSIGFSSGDAVLRENRLVDDDLFEVDGDPYYDRAYFDDDAIDGETYTVTIRAASFDEPGVDDRYFVVLESLSEDFYEYLRTREISDYTGENPFAEPVSVHSNIEDGFGIFAGYATSAERFR